MIGFDDIYDCYLSTEIDTDITENTENNKNLKVHELKKQSVIKYVESITEESVEMTLEEQSVEMAPIIEPEYPKLHEGLSETTSDIFYDVIEKSNSSEKEIFEEIIVTIEPESDNLDLSVCKIDIWKLINL